MENSEKKLELDKSTIAHLNESEMNDLKGGGTFDSELAGYSDDRRHCELECTDYCHAY